jgi:hypothetical protein
MDCTFCLDCVHACPHDNVGIVTRVPGLELADERRRSGIGRLQNRWDIAALASVFAFGALLNAFAMSTPIHATERLVAAWLGTTSEAVILGVIFAAGLGAVPLVLLTMWPEPRRFALALIPVGAGVWSAHYLFHLLTAAWTIVPVTQSALNEWSGFAIAGDPLWRLTGMRPGAVLPLQLGLILLGTCGSLAVLTNMRVARRGARVPWTIVVVLLAIAAAWLMTEPMDMRGLGMAG